MRYEVWKWIELASQALIKINKTRKFPPQPNHPPRVPAVASIRCHTSSPEHTSNRHLEAGLQPA